MPEGVLTNEDITKEFSDWPSNKIEEKTGIVQRHVASNDECASDLAFQAVKKLFAKGVCNPKDINFLILCTQSPDYFLPTTACLLQERLALSNTIGAFDFNLGCSGYVYGLSIAKGLIESGQVQNVLLATAETYSKFISPSDKGVLSIFGDGATATLIQAVDDEVETFIGPFVFGTDGKGGDNLIVSGGGLRNRERSSLFMNGPEIFTFTYKTVPDAVNELLRLGSKTIADIDLFVFHQANKYMLEHLRNKLDIPPEKFVITMKDYGNTVSSTIPIALKDAGNNGLLTKGQKIMLVGFGVGYSWATTIIKNMMD